MTKRLEYLHVCRFLVVCQGSLRIWAYHIQAVKLNGKSIDQDNLWNKYSQPSQYEAACPNAPVSTFRDAVLTSRHDTESIYHGPEPLWRAFQWFWWIGSLQYDESIISQFRSWHQQTTMPKRKSRKFVFPSIHGLLMFAWYVEGSSFCTWRLCHTFSQNLVTSTWSVWMACGLLFVDIRNLWKTPRPRGRTIYGGARNGQFNAWEDLRRCIWQSFAKDQAVSDR